MYMDTKTQDQIANILLTCGTEAQQREALLYASGLLHKEQSKWFLSASPLEDGWYWRKCSKTDSNPECIKVCNGVMIDAEPIDSHGVDWHLFENSDFQDYWFSGPIEVPVSDKVENFDCHGL